jgi:16S rRNA (adenine1518-N6/adenine1519-N6)-dimethyltransferase
LNASDALPPLREVIARHGLAARHRLGQHFLLDLNLTGRIARAAGELASGTTIEIGPGPGGLTRALLAHGAGRVIAIERDERCLPALAEIAAAYPGRLEVIAGNALGIHTERLGVPPRRVVANLPYNIATPLLLGWLAVAERFERMVLMFQREVAARLVAQPRSADYGRLAIATQWRCQARRLFDIPPRAFTPPPKVTSSLVELKPRETPLAPADPILLERVTAAAFGQRRKMLRQSLRRLTPDPGSLLASAGIVETKRAEELSVADFARLAEALRTFTGPRAGL